MNTIVKILITAIAAFVISKLLDPHVEVESFGSAIIFAIILGLLNLIVKPILSILSLPVTVITLGFFALIINTLIILMADYFTGGINIEGFWWAFVFSILLSIVTSVLESVFISKKEE